MSPASPAVRAQPGHQVGVGPLGHEADVLAVRLGRNRQAKPGGMAPYYALVRHVAERETREGELVASRGEQEPALVARRVGGAAQLRPIRTLDAPHVMPGRHRLRAEVARQGQQIRELHRHVAADAGHRRLPGGVAVGEVADHGTSEPGLRVDHVVRDAEAVGHVPRVVDVLPGAAGTPAASGGAVVVKLQGDADHLVPGLVQQPGDHAAVHAAGHRGDDTHDAVPTPARCALRPGA